MKYNKSKIMQNAWKKYNVCEKDIYGKKKKTFGECLKESWAEAKRKAAENEKMENIINNRGYNYFTAVINFCEVTINRCDNVVSGNTYKIKGILKKHGFHWNPFEKYWENGDVNAFIADVIV